MTRKEASDLAFEKTMDYIRSINVSADGKTLALIARAIGNYETEMQKLEPEITKGASHE